MFFMAKHNKNEVYSGYGVSFVKILKIIIKKLQILSLVTFNFKKIFC
jgi:hypothetical protein